MLDESGFSLCLAPAYGWSLKGRSNQRRVPTRWGSQGRINLIGTLAVGKTSERLEYELVEGSCRSAEVVAYLEALAEEAERSGKPCVVVLDNAPFHKSKAVGEKAREWEARGLTLYRLPAVRT